MNLIKKLLNRNDTRRLYLMKDIYFVIDFVNQTIIPYIYNENYISVLRLDTMEVFQPSKTNSSSDSFEYIPNYISKKAKGAKSFNTFLYKNEEYEINDIAIKLLFANNYKNMDFLSDLQVLNSEQLEEKYNLARRFHTFKKHVYSHNVAYTSQEEIMNTINFILKSRTFKNEIANFKNIKRSADSRIF